MRFTLCALASMLLVSATAYYVSNESAWLETGWEYVYGAMDSTSPLDTSMPPPAMEMDLLGNVHISHPFRPAPPTPEYNETLIVELITEIANTIQRLVRKHELERIIWPPPEGHQLSFTDMPANISIDPRIVSLMRRLPSLAEWRQEILHMMEGAYFLGERGVYFGRWIDERNGFSSSDPDWDPVLAPPTAFEWLNDNNENMPRVILDVAENTFRKVGIAEYPGDAYTKHEKDPKKLEDYQCDYRNWPAKPAPDYLRSILVNLRNAVWIPGNYRMQVLDPANEDKWTHEVQHRRRLLIERYGWPDNFREEAWKAEVLRDAEEWEEYDFWMQMEVEV